jgi:hypothetical protein
MLVAYKSWKSLTLNKDIFNMQEKFLKSKITSL